MERVINNPHKSEKIIYGKINGKEKYREVLYYVKYVVEKNDSSIHYTFEPLIFEDNRLIDEGYHFLEI